MINMIHTSTKYTNTQEYTNQMKDKDYNCEGTYNPLNCGCII